MEIRSVTGPAAFVATHQRGLLRWLRALGCDPHQAEEHAQDALLAALHHNLDQRPARTARAWLRTTARNLWRMELRRRGRRPDERAFEEVEQAWQAIDGDGEGDHAALDALQRCLDVADSRDRELLEQRYRDELPREVMARNHGLSGAGIKQALRRARARIQHCVERRLSGEEREEAR